MASLGKPWRERATRDTATANGRERRSGRAPKRRRKVRHFRRLDIHSSQTRSVRIASTLQIMLITTPHDLPQKQRLRRLSRYLLARGSCACEKAGFRASSLPQRRRMAAIRRCGGKNAVMGRSIASRLGLRPTHLARRATPRPSATYFPVSRRMRRGRVEYKHTVLPCVFPTTLSFLARTPSSSFR